MSEIAALPTRRVRTLKASSADAFSDKAEAQGAFFILRHHDNAPDRPSTRIPACLHRLAC